MGDHSDVPPWTRRILPLNFYTKFFRADVFYRIMTEREKERKDQMEEEKNREREGGRKEKERERASTWTSRRIYFSCGNTRARENERNRERGERWKQSRYRESRTGINGRAVKWVAGTRLSSRISEFMAK